MANRNYLVSYAVCIAASNNHFQVKRKRHFLQYSSPPSTSFLLSFLVQDLKGAKLNFFPFFLKETGMKMVSLF